MDKNKTFYVIESFDDDAWISLYIKETPDSVMGYCTSRRLMKAHKFLSRSSAINAAKAINKHNNYKADVNDHFAVYTWNEAIKIFKL